MDLQMAVEHPGRREVASMKKGAALNELVVALVVDELQAHLRYQCDRVVSGVGRYRRTKATGKPGHKPHGHRINKLKNGTESIITKDLQVWS